MEGEAYNLLVDWSIALASLLYCHSVAPLIPQGKTRLLALIPIICLFFYLPLNLTTMFFCGLTFFFMSWLGTFKLMLFAFGQGPLASNPPLPLSHFIPIACLPIKIMGTNSRFQETPYQKIPEKPRKSIKDYAIRVIIFLMTVKVYSYKEYVHPLLTTLIYVYYIFFMLELMLALAAFMVRALVGVELEPQFDEPHNASSVQNFWGKRWNLMVSSILRPTVYQPMRKICGHVIPQRWVSVPAVFTTFLVSGVMHEAIFYYLGRLEPTWEVTCFFIVQGLCVCMEIVVKKTFGHKFEPPPAVARTLTLGFVILTCFWLFFPPFLRFNPFVRGCREVMAFVDFLKHGRMINPDESSCPYI